MRKLVLLGWLMVPVVAVAYHYGPGQQRLQLDEAGLNVAEAERQAEQGNWGKAVASYEKALELLPAERVHEARRIRLERAKAQMLCSQLPEAHDELVALVEEMQQDEASDPQLLDEARQSLAGARYYMTWLMRLEGQPRDVWEPEIEAARQTYRLLAEKAEQNGEDESAEKHREDLESAVRLARLDLTDLEGLPLPSQ